MVINGEKINLRTASLEDTELIVNWRNQEDIMSMSISQTAFTKEGHESWYKDKITAGRVVLFIICDVTTGKPIGSTSLAYTNKDKSEAELGYYIGEGEYRGKGLGSEALRLTVDYGMKQLGLNQIIAEVLDINERSLSCFIKNGFKIDNMSCNYVEREGKRIIIKRLYYK